MLIAQQAGSGNYCVYLVREEHQEEWIAKAGSGNEIAKLCLSASSNYVKAMQSRPFACGCCYTRFTLDDVPRVFIVAIPVEPDPEMVTAHTKAVCSECGKHGDKWLIDRGVRREGLTPTTARRSDRIH
jgi:hypothetical protein